MAVTVVVPPRDLALNDLSNVSDADFRQKAEDAGLPSAADVVAAEEAAEAAAAAAEAAAASSLGLIVYVDGDPTDDIGVNGSTAIDYSSGTLIGPKASGTWAGAGQYVFASFTPPFTPPAPGLFLAWYPADGVAAKGVIPNDVTAVALPNNILRVVPGVNYLGLLTATGATLTPNGGNDPAGNPKAFRAVSTDTTGRVRLTGLPLDAGSYFFAEEAVSHNRSSTYTTFIGDGGSVSVGPAYATKTDAVTVAVTGLSFLDPVYRNTTGDAYDIDFAHLRLFSGGSDLGADVNGGHLLLGKTALDPDNPTFSTAVSDQYGVALLAAPKTFSEITIIAAFNQTGDTSANYAPIFSADSFLDLMFGLSINALKYTLGGTTVAVTGARPRNLGWVITAFRARTGDQETYVSSALVYKAFAAWSGFTTTAAYQGYRGNDGIALPTGTFYGPTEVYDLYLDDSELLTAIEAMRTRLVAESQTPAVIDFTVNGLGDSITDDAIQVGTGGTGSYFRRIVADNPTWQYQALATGATGLDLDNPGIPGSSVNDRIDQQIDSIELAVSDGVTPIFTCLIGGNDGARIEADPEAYFEDLQEAWAKILDAGGKIIPLTITPKDPATYSAFNTAAAIVNQLMEDNPSSYTALVDLRATAVGTWSGTYYYDFIHMNGAGYDVVTPLVQAALDAVIAAL